MPLILNVAMPPLNLGDSLGHGAVMNQDEECAGGVMPAANFTERMQVFRLRRHEDAIPCVRTQSHDTRQSAIRGTKAHGSDEGGEITTQGSHRGVLFRPGIHRGDKKYGGTRELSVHSLRYG